MTHRFIASRRIRPWWGLGFVRHDYAFTVSSDDDEAQVLRKLAAIKAQFPKWEIRPARDDE